MNGQPGHARADQDSADVDELELAAIPSAVSLTRRFTEAYLRKRDLDEMTDTARLIASELVTNAIRATGLPETPVSYTGLHGAKLARITVRLRMTPPGLLIEIQDDDPRPPVRVRPGALDEGGRGLLLVTALAAAWGHYPWDGGKVVWAEITLSGHPPGKARALSPAPPTGSTRWLPPPPRSPSAQGTPHAHYPGAGREPAMTGRHFPGQDDGGTIPFLDWTDWSAWSVVLLKPDCLERGLADQVLAHIAAHAAIVTRQTVTVTEAQIFAHYDDLLREPERVAPVDVAADLRRRYAGQPVVTALAHGPAAGPGEPGTPARLRALLGHYDPTQADPCSIRGCFGTDSLAAARSQNRLIDNLIHTSDDSAAARRDFLIWFGPGQVGLLAHQS